jgi:predicted RNA-binding protein
VGRLPRLRSARLSHMARTYWIDLFTVETWKEFQDHGSDVSGFSEKRWKTVQRMKPGDYLLCYLRRKGQR